VLELNKQNKSIGINMNKIAHYLQNHLRGEVMDSKDARIYFANDNSILTLTPTIIAYPKNENDVRKAARFSWQLAERGRLLPITSRGSGSDQTGAAIGSGLVMIFPAHMNKIIELDTKSGIVTVEPGIIFGKLQQSLKTHGLFLPAYPSSLEYSTIGGAIGNNAGGEKSVKYGDTRESVKSLRVVLANGEVIETKPLNKRELKNKLGLTTFEGEIYRSLDALLEENKELIKTTELAVSRNGAGYDLRGVITKKGFDLTPLIVGSQGTLGIVTEATLTATNYSEDTSLTVGFFDGLGELQEALNELKSLPESPSEIEIVDEQFLNMVNKINPNLLKDVLPEIIPKFILFVEFDNANDRLRRKLTKKASRIFSKYASANQMESNADSIDNIWKIRNASSVILNHVDGNTRPLPLLEDGIVPVERLADFVDKLYQIFSKNHIDIAIWGHAGEGNLHIQPFLDLAVVGDRQKVFRMMEEYYSMIIEMGGSTSSSYNDGRLRSLYLERLYGKDAYDLMIRIKNIFDPHNILNPGVKVNTKVDDVKNMLRQEYIRGFNGFLPKS
jgi:FAD/FMN-containing dehydrogenase